MSTTRARRGTGTTIRDDADLHARAEALRGDLADADRRLRTALVDGSPTSAIRIEIADLVAGIEHLAARQREAEMAEEQRRADKIAVEAEQLAAAAVARVSAKLGALQPPPTPWGPGAL
jgi:hypothetical protein